MRGGDRLALLLMVLVPLIIFGVPALFSHPAIAQDNLIQNFPLRVLTGQQIRSGHLPLLNPLANSGTPLLGGMNAGSFYPLTMLFVFLPAVVAWVLNLVAIYVTAALGVFALLRWHSVKTLSAAVASFVFAYSGAMIGQMVHLGVVQGFSLMPWMILALSAMAHSVVSVDDVRWTGYARRLMPSALGVSGLWALACLSGEPRAIAELELLSVLIVATLTFVRSELQPNTWRSRVAYLGGFVSATALGVVIGLAQLLPGWKFITQSQRASISYSFFGAGSLPVRWTAMLFDQTILGGNGVLHQPTFFSNYNLPEVTGYTGILAIVALSAFLTRCTRSGWRHRDRTYVLYLVIVIVGLFATWGSFTPFGHLFQHFPLFGSTRVQSRNIVLVDLGAAGLLGLWLDPLQDRDIEEAGILGWRRWFTLLPAVLTVAVAGTMLMAGRWLSLELGAWRGSNNMANYEQPTLIIQIAIAASIGAVLWIWRERVNLVRWLTVIAVVDTVVFLTFSSTGFVAGHVNIMPSRASATSLLGGYGRFALVDPTGDHLDQFENLGSPNMNVFTEIPSIQGYGSLIESLYGDVTASHPLFSLDPCKLADGTFIQLRLASFAISSSELSGPLTLASAPGLRCLPLKSNVRTQRYFGQLLLVRDITVEGSNGHRVSSGEVFARLLAASGRPVGPKIEQPGTPITVVNFRGVHDVASGVQIDAPSGAKISSTTVAVSGAMSQTYLLNTPFQQALSSPLWHLTDTVGTIAVFKATHVRPIAWIGTNKSTSKILDLQNSGWGDSWITVRAAHRTVLKRSQAWLAGWRATARNTVSGKVLSLDVVRSGLIQQVVVPPGTWQVHFHYHAPYIETGLAASTAGALVWFALLGSWRGWWRPRRSSKVRT